MRTVLATCAVVWWTCGAMAADVRPAVTAHSGEEVLQRLTAANDEIVGRVLGSEPAGRFGGARGSGAQIMILAAAYTNPRSRYHHDDTLLPAIDRSIEQLAASQNPSGLWDGGNLDSPPDSAFVLKTLAKGQHFLVTDDRDASRKVREALKRVILQCAEGVRVGGVHTPNHRWAVCAALAHVHRIYPDTGYVERIDQWLAEGIDVDEDGLWAERSSNYTSDVCNPAILEVAVLLKRPELLEPIRRSLDASYYFFEPDGEVDTISSRRQDQRPGAIKHAWEYYVPYRYLAVRDANGRYAALAHWMEQEFLGELGANATNMSSPLTCMLMFPEMVADLPKLQPPSTEFAHVFSHNAIARIRRGEVTATVFGGSDWYAGLGHGSGLSTNPTFFKLRKGDAILESVRMTPSFFSTGFFYSEGLRVQDGTYTLWQDLNVPYHQPLPATARKADGQYALQPDMIEQDILGRFFSKMAFAERPSHFVTLRTQVDVREEEGEFALAITVDGPEDVPLTIELAFREGGTFSGVEKLSSIEGAATAGRGRRLSPEDLANAYVLREGVGTYKVGNDVIEFGPGTFWRPPGRMEGESVTWVGGRMTAVGNRVYLTGRTPFQHVLRFR